MMIKNILAISVLLFGLVSCSADKSGEASKDVEEHVPLNISVFLDLSDRLAREMVPSQTERDSMIIDCIMDIFINDCVANGKIIRSKNHFQIFFHPSPQTSEIATLARNLNLDLAKIDTEEKKSKLKSMKETFANNISQIYQSTLQDQKWIGSDIWAFFSDKKVDVQCIRPDYRNILIILTDGYLYYAPNKQNCDNAYSYVLPQILKNPSSSLMVKRDGLDDLEVLLLEVNPYAPSERDRLIQVLENWFTQMGVKHFVVADTDMPVNTENVIRNFIECQ